jgi:hypothetical protein
MEELNVALNYTFPVLPYNNTLTTQAYQKKKTKKTHGYLLWPILSLLNLDSVDTNATDYNKSSYRYVSHNQYVSNLVNNWLF